jgi:hypothetical protein
LETHNTDSITHRTLSLSLSLGTHITFPRRKWLQPLNSLDQRPRPGKKKRQATTKRTKAGQIKGTAHAQKLELRVPCRHSIIFSSSRLSTPLPSGSLPYYHCTSLLVTVCSERFRVLLLLPGTPLPSGEMVVKNVMGGHGVGNGA